MNKKQLFEVTWQGGKITEALIASLLQDYFTKLQYPRQEIIVAEQAGKK